MDKKLVVPFFVSLICVIASAFGWALLVLDYRADIAFQLLLAPPFLMTGTLGPLYGEWRELIKADAQISTVTICATALSTIPQLIYWLV